MKFFFRQVFIFSILFLISCGAKKRIPLASEPELSEKKHQVKNILIMDRLIQVEKLNQAGKWEKFSIRSSSGKQILVRDFKNKKKNRLFIYLDGVGFKVISKLWHQGYFRPFNFPTKVLGTYPSLTGIGFTAMLKTKKVHGYEDLYFDNGEKKLKGGFYDYLFNSNAPEKLGQYFSFFDYKQHRAHELYFYFMPVTATFQEFDDLLSSDKFNSYLKNPKGDFHAYIFSTDGLAHVLGEKPTIKVMKYFDSVLKYLLSRVGDKIEIHILSDHGQFFQEKPLVSIPLEKYLQEFGLQPKDHLEEVEDVAVPYYGLISGASLYTNYRQKMKFCKYIVQKTGMRFCIYEEKKDYHFIVGKSGVSVIQKLPGDRVKVIPQAGNPLGIDKKYFLKEMAYGEWLKIAENSKYPAAPVRIVKGGEYLLNPASITLCAEDGYFIGSWISAFSDVKGTHGNLSADSSWAVYMTTEVNPEIKGPILMDNLNRILKLNKNEGKQGE